MACCASIQREYIEYDSRCRVTAVLYIVGVMTVSHSVRASEKCTNLFVFTGPSDAEGLACGLVPAARAQLVNSYACSAGCTVCHRTGRCYIFIAPKVCLHLSCFSPYVCYFLTQESPPAADGSDLGLRHRYQLRRRCPSAGGRFTAVVSISASMFGNVICELNATYCAIRSAYVLDKLGE